MEEIWRPVIGFETSHEVSNLGQARTILRRDHILANKRGRGYYRTVLTVSGEQHGRMTHRLVAEAFIGPAPSPQHEINHIDGDKTNNRADNLEWVTRSENGLHAYRNRLSVSRKGSSHGRSKLTEDQVREIRKLGGTMTQREIASRFDVKQPQIYRILSGKRWAHLG